MSRFDTGIWHIINCPIFEKAGPEERMRLAAASEVTLHPRNAIVPPPPEGEESVFVVMHGHVQLGCIDERGREIIALMLGPCDMFGSLSDRPKPFGEHYRCLTDVQLCRITRTRFEAFLKRHPETAFELSKAAIDRADALQLRLTEVLLRQADERLALALIRLGEAIGRVEPDGRRKLTVPLTHSDLAKLIGTSREMVTVLLGQFRRAGLVTVERGWMYLVDEVGLAQVVSPEPVKAKV